MLNSFWIVTIFTIYQALEVGIVELIEYRYVNEKIFTEHNFIHILRFPRGADLKYPSLMAILSGFVCCIPLLISLGFKLCLLFSVRKKKINNELLKECYIAIACILTIGDIIALYIYDISERGAIPDYIYCGINHTYFYIFHILSEIVSILSIIASLKIV